ncbi:uncharacterized protein LOC111122584 isoform X2 [Crassostrea virginica]|uniref:Uncharacterized protein LOC111122584 isoform X2 n=1 Tax=Crassostrea virginica TaxID=6565 RepID=A0A8B8CWA9_CRAVI|nr:uncharacterized protein LOC111122584 isoform X2 [Crassostrea virginica]
MKSQLFTYLTFATLYGIGLSGAQGRKKRRENTVVCEAGSNTFYHPQAEKCLQCDKCNMGYSMVPLQEYSLKMDREHGALNCLPCRKCQPGTYNDMRTFELTCKTCRNCTALGRVEESPCTPLTNAVCGDVLEFSSTDRLQAEAKEVKSPTYQDPPSYHVLLVVSLVLMSFFILIATAFVFLRRAHKRASTSQQILKVTKNEEEDSLQCLNNFQSNASNRISASKSTVINIPIENEETRPKEKVYVERRTMENTRSMADGISPTNLTSDSTSEKTPKSSTNSSWNVGKSDLHSSIPDTQFSIGYTNLALSRSFTCPPSGRFSEHHSEEESMEMLSQFSYVLD